MTLEICFRRTSDINTGIVTVGTYMPGVQDYNDFRFFLANTSTVICDCGTGASSSYGSGARMAINVDDKTDWHVVKFPVIVNGAACALIDDVPMDYSENGGFRQNGMFGVKTNALTFFSNSQTNASQQIALRYVNVLRYDTGALLASFQPDMRTNGIIDIVSRKSYVPVTGEVKILKLKNM